MNNKITLGGISITVNFCKKINKEPINNTYKPAEPLVTIYKTQKENTYTVNIMVYVPIEKKLIKLNESTLNSGLFLNKEGTLFLNYNGVHRLNTTIGSESLLCRNFNIKYDCKSPIIEDYDSYQVQFEYQLMNTNFQSVDALIVKLTNEDPETERGTVTGVRH